MIKSKYTMIMLKLIEAKRLEIEIQSISKVRCEESSKRFLGRKEELDDSTIHSTSIKCGSQRDWRVKYRQSPVS